MYTKPRRRWYQFSLKTMFGATTCFALSATAAALARQIDERGGFPAVLLLAGICFPLVSIGFGSGIGMLCNRAWFGLLAGAAIGFLPLVATIVSGSW